MTKEHWCLTHKRVATYVYPDDHPLAGQRRCDPALGGIMLPCEVTDHPNRYDQRGCYLPSPIPEGCCCLWAEKMEIDPGPFGIDLRPVRLHVWMMAAVIGCPYHRWGER